MPIVLFPTEGLNQMLVGDGGWKGVMNRECMDLNLNYHVSVFLLCKVINSNSCPV